MAHLAPVPDDRGMGYGIAIVAVIFVVVIVMMLTRRAGGASSEEGPKRPLPHGVTVEEPAGDQPTPQAGRTVNKISVDTAKKIPPG